MFDFLCFLIIVYGLILLIRVRNFGKLNNNYPKSIKIHNKKYAILIPARDESLVIEDLLMSIKRQTLKINFNDIYIIVENNDDPTIDIAAKYKANIIYRHDLTKKRKGYALDDALKEILDNKIDYTAYFIMDADNILDKNFFLEMDKTVESGYDIGIGYRNCKNGNSSVVAAASSLTFSMINTLSNETKQIDSRNLTVSGTGFYIKGSILKDLEGYPFYSLTEDYELSLYATLNKLTTYYNTKAIFYDEQPVTFNKTISQRIRWIKGYFDSRKEYIPKLKKQLLENDNNYGSEYCEIVGVKPYIYMVIGIVGLIIHQVFDIIIRLINKGIWYMAIEKIICLVLIAYIFLVFVTFLMLKKDKSINLKKSMKIKVLFYNPLYLTSYIYCALKAVLTREVVWEKVEHSYKVNKED